MAIQRSIKKIGILPWVENDEHQANFAMALEDAGYIVVKITYKKGLPLTSALKDNPVDLLVLDWVHSFFISNSLGISLAKTILQFWDRRLVRTRETLIIWNMHNLHRHDKKFLKLEKYNFKKLAGCVDGIRVFNDYSIGEVKKYLNLDGGYPIVSIPQGKYETGKVAFANQTNNTKSSSEHILLFFGSIRAGKGLDKFLLTFSKLKSDTVRLIIAGAPMDQELSHLVKKKSAEDKRITLIDRFIPDAEVAELFEKSFALVLPYENILNSGVQILAHSYSKPILANDIPVFRQGLSETYTEFFSLDNAASLKNAITTMGNRNYQEMQIASNDALDNRKWDDVVKKILNFAEKLQKNSRTKLKII